VVDTNNPNTMKLNLSTNISCSA